MYQINRKTVITMKVWLNLTTFRIDFFLNRNIFFSRNIGCVMYPTRGNNVCCYSLFYCYWRYFIVNRLILHRILWLSCILCYGYSVFMGRLWPVLVIQRTTFIKCIGPFSVCPEFFRKKNLRNLCRAEQNIGVQFKI